MASGIYGYIPPPFVEIFRPFISLGVIGRYIA